VEAERRGREARRAEPHRRDLGGGVAHLTTPCQGFVAIGVRRRSSKRSGEILSLQSGKPQDLIVLPHQEL
jgi:hypothetical protein